MKNRAVEKNGNNEFTPTSVRLGAFSDVTRKGFLKLVQRSSSRRACLFQIGFRAGYTLTWNNGFSLLLSPVVDTEKTIVVQI